MRRLVRSSAAGQARRRLCCSRKAGSGEAAHSSLLYLAGAVCGHSILAQSPRLPLVPFVLEILRNLSSPATVHHLPQCLEPPPCWCWGTSGFCPALPGTNSSGAGLGDLTHPAGRCFSPPSPSAASGMVLSWACSSFLASRKAISA